MRADVGKRGGAHVKRADIADVIQYRVIYAVCFTVFLAAAIIERLLPWNWVSQRAKAERRQSILEQAGEAAGTCTTYAFMS